MQLRGEKEEKLEGRNLSEEGLGVLLAKAEQSNGLGSFGVGDKNELIVRIADGVNRGADEGLGDVMGTQCGSGGEGMFGR